MLIISVTAFEEELRRIKRKLRELKAIANEELKELTVARLTLNKYIIIINPAVTQKI